MNQTSSAECRRNEHCYSPMDESLPPPAYCYESLSGISEEIDGWITGKASYCHLISCEQVVHLTNMARRHRLKLTQVPSTIEAIKNASSSHRRLRVVGLKSLPAAIVHDVVAPPYHLTQMVIAISRGKLERKKADAGILDEIMESLFLSLEAALRMVTRLGLETHKAVERIIQHEGGYIFLTLARLLEAYMSRFAPSGTVYLASRKRLPKQHCSGTARLHFEQIHSLKEALNFVDLSPEQDLDNSAVLERCLRRVFPALKEPFVDSSENLGFSHVIQRLRHISKEMPLLCLKTGK